jgi:hypothetical protein
MSTGISREAPGRRQPERLVEFGYDAAKDMPLADLVRAAALVAGVSVSHFIGPDRDRAVVRPRQCAIWIAHNATQRSIPEIGRRFGRDKTTVFYAINATAARLEGANLRERGQVRAAIEAILAQFKDLPAAEVETRIVVAKAKIALPPRPDSKITSLSDNGWESDARTRRWFAENDAAFRAAFAAAYPERVRS